MKRRVSMLAAGIAAIALVLLGAGTAHAGTTTKPPHRVLGPDGLPLDLDAAGE